jgi:cell volume regulation protein A
MGIDELNAVLLGGAAILLIAVVAVRFSSGAGLPSLLMYLGIGAALAWSELIVFDDAELAEVLGISALVIILAEGGLTTRWRNIRPVLPQAGMLATVGVAVSVGVVGVIAHLLFDLDWRLAFLYGAVLSSTDAAAVFSTLRRVALKPSLGGTLEAESGVNDAPVIILVTLLSETHGSSGVLSAIGLLVYELVVGAGVGLGMGWLGGVVLRRAALPASGLYPIAVMTFAVLAYAGGAFVHASGFLAVYLAALVLGNSDVPHRSVSRGFAEALGWVAQIGLFVMLGLLVVPIDDFVGTIAPAVGIGLALLLVARPLSVLVSVTPFRVPWRDQVFLSWGGLRGAVPIVIATLPVVAGVKDSDRLLDVVFVLVVLFTLVQSPALPWLARTLRVDTRSEPRELAVEAAPLERVRADLLQVTIPRGSRLHGVEVAELRLPAGASVALIVRGGNSMVPSPTTPLQRGDEVLVVVPRKARAITEARLASVSRNGRLAGWLRH